MSQQPDPEWDDALAWLHLTILALPLLPIVLGGVSKTAERWMLGHGVLVRGREALFTLPGMTSGPDLRRLVAVVLVMIGLLVLMHRISPAPRRRR